MIGGLLRFAPGRLGARTRSRARGLRDRSVGRVVVVMPCLADELDTEARAQWRVPLDRRAGMATGSAQRARCVSVAG